MKCRVEVPDRALNEVRKQRGGRGLLGITSGSRELPTRRLRRVGLEIVRDAEAGDRVALLARHVRGRALALAHHVRDGRIAEAVREFYAPALIQRANAMPPLMALLACNRPDDRTLDEAHPGVVVRGVGVNGDTSFIECGLVLPAESPSRSRIERVAVARWRNGRIVHESLMSRS